MKESKDTLFSRACERIEAPDGSIEQRLKQGEELRALLEGHTADEPGYELVVMSALYDVSTPKGAQMNIKHKQEQIPSVILDSYPDPKTAEDWLRFAEEKTLSCLDELYAWMANRYETGVELICPQKTPYEAVVSAEKTNNLLSSAATNNPDAIFQLYRMISNGKYQQQKRLLLQLTQFVPFLLLIPAAKCFYHIAEGFFAGSFSPFLFDIKSLILYLIGFAISLCVYVVLYSKVTSVAERYDLTLNAQKSELLHRAVELGGLDAQYELMMQRPASERDQAFTECFSYAKQGCNAALETLISWCKKGYGEPAARSEADDFLVSQNIPQEGFLPSQDKRLLYLGKAAELHNKYVPQYGEALLYSDVKKGTEVLTKGAEAGDAKCMRLLSWRYREPQFNTLPQFLIMFLLVMLLFLGLLEVWQSSVIEELFSKIADQPVLYFVLAFAVLIVTIVLLYHVTYRLIIVSPRSHFWQKRAAKAGDAKALYDINEFVVSYTVRKQNYVKSAEAGYEPAMAWMSKRYERGSRKYKIEKDPQKAFFWAEKMSESESADGLARLAYCYERGIGVERSLVKAAQLYFLGKSFGIGDSTFLNRRLHFLQLFGHLDPLYIGMRELEHEQDIGKTLQDIFSGIQTGNADRVTNALMDLSVRTVSLKKQLSEQSEQFLDYCEKLTKETIHIAEQDLTNYEKAEGELKLYFGDDWGRLTEQCRIALISAHCLLSATSEYDAYDFDYSGVSITATSALEGELQRYFLDGPRNYFRREFGTKYFSWPKPFVHLEKDGTYSETTRFELGMLRYLLNIPRNDDNFSQENGNVLTNYLKDNVKPEFYRNSSVYLCFKNPITIDGKQQKYGFLDLVDQIRKNYRNPSAHASKVSRKDAEDCCRAVMGYVETKENISNAEAALRVLLRIVR